MTSHQSLQRIPIRTSDRNSFRRCRVAWHFGSSLRCNKTKASPGIETKNLDFGSAIHAGLEVWYDADKQPKNLDQYEMLKQESLAAFNTYMQKWRDILIAGNRFHPEAKDQWEKYSALGNDMLKRYFNWSVTEDLDYEILYSEIEFEVPLEIKNFNPNWTPGDSAFQQISNTVEPVPGIWILENDPSVIDLGIDPNKFYLCLVDESSEIVGIIVIQGRIDLVVRHKRTGKIKIIDHKTADKFYDDWEWLDLDPQASTYYYALRKVLNIDADEVIFNQLRKKSPIKPRVLKSGYLSQAKDQNTTIEIYKEEIKKLGHSELQYQDFLDNFEDPVFFRRINTSRTSDELDAIELNIIYEAIDMLSNPRIYPNPNAFNCSSCAFREPCRLRQTDSIEYSEWFLNESGAYVESQGY